MYKVISSKINKKYKVCIQVYYSWVGTRGEATKFIVCERTETCMKLLCHPLKHMIRLLRERIYQWLMIRQNYELPTVSMAFEVTNGSINCQELSIIYLVSFFTIAQFLRKETQRLWSSRIRRVTAQH